MKKIKILKIKIIIILMICLGFVGTKITLSHADETKFKSKFETWGNDLSEEELEEFYATNEGGPCTSDPAPEHEITEYTVAAHLSGRFPGYTSWTVSGGKSVSDIYNQNPPESKETQPYVQDAIAEIPKFADGTPVGCGNLALLTQFTFLACCAGYYPLAPDIVYPVTKDDEGKDELIEDPLPANTALAKEIFPLPTTHDGGKDGTLIYPIQIIAASKELLVNHKLATRDGNDLKDPAIYVSGDIIFNLSSHQTKINNLIKSIDDGMPVIWWTYKDLGKYSKHYMNIYGYEYFEGTNEAGETYRHLMFLLRMNWGREVTVYLDSDTLAAGNSGFIYFEEAYQKSYIEPEDYGLDCIYLNNVSKKTVTPSIGMSISIEYLRAGYVNKYNEDNTTVIGKEISLSAHKNGCGEAYIYYRSTTAIKYLFIEISWWSDQEYIDSSTGAVDIMCPYEDNQWESVYNFLTDVPGGISYDKENKTLVSMCFISGLGNIKLDVKSFVPTGTRNKGRITIGRALLLQH